MSELKAMVDWCSTHISPKKYYLPFSKSIIQGGKGWEISSCGSKLTIRITDEKTLVWFLLIFGQTGITVAPRGALEIQETT